MADNKQYITHKQENGKVLISEDVIATIVSNALKEVDGIAGMCTKPGSDITEAVGRKGWSKGIKITIGKENELNVEANVNIAFGQNVVEVANAAQKAVAAELETLAGITAANIGVNVCGIVRQ